MPYPSTVTSFTNPLPTDRLNSPSHSSIETAQNTGLTELQTFVGTLASTAGTLIYDIRATASDGGGHVQSANKGGTGQTSYAKGDTLAATSSSVLSKLAVGTDGQVLTADSSVAAGVKWASPTTAFSNKIAVVSSIQIYGASIATEVSIFSVTIPGSTLGTNDAVRATLFINQFQQNQAAGSVLLNVNYGSNTIANTFLTGNLANASINGKIEYNLLANNSSSVQQRGNVYIDFDTNNRLTSGGAATSFLSGFITGTSSIASTAPATMGMTVRFSDNSPANFIAINGYIVEKIS